LLICGNSNYTIFNLTTNNITINKLINIVNTTGGVATKDCKFSKNNYYAIAIGQYLYVFNDNHQVIYSYDANSTGNFVGCLDWSPDGTALAFGSKFVGIFVY